MRKEQIRSTYTWRGGSSCQDYVLVDSGCGGEDQPTSGFSVARVLLLFSFRYGTETFPCALVWRYILADESGSRDEDTGMWLVERGYHDGDPEKPELEVIPIGSIFRAVHLLPFFGKEPVSRSLMHEDSLDEYAMFYVNRFADHHSFEIL